VFFPLPRSMEYQASPAFSNVLMEKCVEFLAEGDLKDEWNLYAIAHPIGDVGENLRCPDGVVERMLEYDRANGRSKLFGALARSQARYEGRCIPPFLYLTDDNVVQFTC
jgi:hypothetical protein